MLVRAKSCRCWMKHKPHARKIDGLPICRTVYDEMSLWVVFKFVLIKQLFAKVRLYPCISSGPASVRIVVKRYVGGVHSCSSWICTSAPSGNLSARPALSALRERRITNDVSMQRKT